MGSFRETYFQFSVMLTLSSNYQEIICNTYFHWKLPIQFPKYVQRSKCYIIYYNKTLRWYNFNVIYLQKFQLHYKRATDHKENVFKVFLSLIPTKIYPYSSLQMPKKILLNTRQMRQPCTFWEEITIDNIISSFLLLSVVGQITC